MCIRDRGFVVLRSTGAAQIGGRVVRAAAAVALLWLCPLRAAQPPAVQDAARADAVVGNVDVPVLAHGFGT
eukprot:1060631-Alexandrium_andersonii.AAC.1